MPVNADPLFSDLPLSWTRSDTNTIEKKSLPFRTNKGHWISLAHILESGNFRQAINTLQEKYPGGLIMRGCSPAIANELKLRNFEILPFGQEAVINLNKAVFEQRALRQSARSGRRHNSIRKIELNEENYKKLNHLKKHSRHGKKPQLKNLFIDTFDSCT